MSGFLILCSRLLYGLISCFGFLAGMRFGSAPKRSGNEVSHREEEAATARQDDPEASVSERDEDDSEAPGGASEYGVFLSFRGQDCRQGLADVLYSDMTTAGIRVFRDNDELEMGDEISKILQAIKNSKICVPIFSETFAASPWCLREVQRMVELGKKIMPVFYSASPDDVKLRTELFKKDLRKHEKKHGKEQVKKWEDALGAVGKIVGREVKTAGFAEFSKLVVGALSRKLMVKTKHVTGFLVKRDDQEKTLMELLDIDSSDVRLVGVHGMGGVGKTTLVKVIFNALWPKFECCSFLENVQESLKYNGLEFLQRQLLGDLDPKLKDFRDIDPISLLSKNFRKRKVFIVLDNVFERTQVAMIAGALDWFGSGSRIIITTRDKRVFTKGTQAFEVSEMNGVEALQLFSWHTFLKDFPPSDYRILSNEVIRCTGRLPLALEVMGSLLHECKKNEWETKIEKLKKIPNRNVQKVLKSSYDALDSEQKQIFLDVSCFFINGEMLTKARYMWEACGFFPDEGIEVLTSMCLLKVDGNQFRMHDCLRDLGREIVREECAGEAAQRSRIWLPGEASDVLKIEKGKETVEGLFLEEQGDGTLTSERFSSFRKLRFLKLVNKRLEGDFDNYLSNLRWFSWHGCPSDFTVTNLYLDKLVVLDLSRSFINENWAGWNTIQMAKDLKELDLTGCCNLTTTPDLSNNTALERLILKGCSRLANIHSSIGKLTRLKHLDLEGCSSLRGLPEELGLLLDIEVISVEGNGNHFHLPESIGKMHSLSVIKLQRVGITRIPDSIEGLGNLVRFSMRGCTRLKELPDSLGDVESLIELDLSGTRLSALPSSVGGLARLQYLNLESTEMEELPDTIGDLKSLLELRMSHTKVSVLPNSIGQLDNLQLLELRATKLKELPDSLGDLISLRTLDLRSSELRVLPDTIGDMSELTKLKMENCKIRELPRSIGKLTKLNYLSAGGSYFLTKVPKEIGGLSSLKELHLGISCSTILPHTVDQLSLLEVLDITVYEDSSLDKEVSDSTFQGLENLPNSVRLTMRFSGLKSIPQLPSTLSHLVLNHIEKEARLPDFSNLKNLVSIEFFQCSLYIDELESIQKLQMLKEILLRNCTKELIDFSCWLENLSSQTISHLESSEEVLDFPRSIHLRHLCVQNCNELVEIRGLEKLESLMSLDIMSCHSLETVGNLSESRGLSRLHISDCPKLREIEGVIRLFLQFISIANCISVRNIDDLKKRCQAGYFNGLQVDNC